MSFSSAQQLLRTSNPFFSLCLIHSETLKYTHFYDMKMGVFQCLRVYIPWDQCCIRLHVSIWLQVSFNLYEPYDLWLLVPIKVLKFLSSHLDYQTQANLHINMSGSVRAIFTTYGMVIIPKLGCKIKNLEKTIFVLKSFW